jgi:hypothetical protein
MGRSTILRMVVCKNQLFTSYSRSDSLHQNSIIEMNIGIICACLPFLKTIAKHHYPESFSDDPVFSTGDAESPQRTSVQWPSTFQTQDTEQPRSDSSIQLTTLSTNASMSIDYRGKDIITSNTTEVPSIQPPEKAMVMGVTQLPEDIP